MATLYANTNLLRASSRTRRWEVHSTSSDVGQLQVPEGKDSLKSPALMLGVLQHILNWLEGAYPRLIISTHLPYPA
jgi:hypothetical protein